ncbi:MAG: GAF domain-containing protein, partial [Candidatus Omnitrophica bacterium]|nr:GAF domain-containing protein [Candidatus Omnitrophota bacterium]
MKQDTLRDFLNSSLKEVMALVHAECGSLFLFDSKKKELILDSFLNAHPLPINGLKLKLGEGVSGKVVATAGSPSPVLVKDIEHDSRFKSNGYKHYQTKSFMCIPLSGEKGLLGVINLADKANGRSFAQEDFAKATVCARYVYSMAQNLLQMHAVQEAKVRLEKKHRGCEKYASIGRLTSGLLHEINSPLDGVMRYANILLARKDQDSVSRNYLLNIKKGLHRITSITRSVLQFSHYARLAPGDGHTNYQSLHGLLDEALEISKPRMNPGIVITRRYEANVEKIIDFGIQHVFLNLIRNALDAMTDRGELTVSTVLTGGELRIGFRDTGGGIAAGDRERIFEPFFTTKPVEKGTGLG